MYSNVSRYQPVLIGGLFIAVAAPLVNSLFNFNRAGIRAGIAVVVLGGMMAVALRQQQLSTPITAGQAVAHGFGAGSVGGVTIFLFSRLFFGQVESAEAITLMGGLDLTPDQVETIRFLASEPIATVLGLVGSVVPFGTLGILGALPGIAFFRKAARWNS